MAQKNSVHCLRQDPISKEWVIFSSVRKSRPHAHKTAPIENTLPRYDPACPFCPGNEKMLPAILHESPGISDQQWSTRSVPNRYPALSSSGNLNREKNGFYLCMGAYGHHEVIIDHPRHNKEIPYFDPEQMHSLIDTYHSRYITLMEDPGVVMVSIFRNHGLRAGTSLLHPHSQIVASPTVPRSIRLQEIRAEEYFDDMGSCIYCDLMHNEIEVVSRIVTQNSSFISFVPYAAKVPYEIWILPKRHTADFGSINEFEKKELSSMLQDLISRLHNHLNDPDYNYLIHSYTRFKSEEPHLHWYIQIIPRILTRAGFEMGSGFFINPDLPEENAKILSNVS
ncbi:MAG: galactose-1-phosphate uridylyltransferase [Fibrobacter sp.]|nr:galactose-1-phosphate uridylyltransferase [Fibrobacter sp.]